MSVSINIKVNEYTSRVLGVIKEKYGLKDKGEALNKFADFYGEQFVDKEVHENIIARMIDETRMWEGNHKFKRKMSLKELDKISGIDV